MPKGVYEHNRGANTYQWKGGKRLTTDGYTLVYCPDNPRSNHRAIKEHILIAEKTAGKQLPPKAVIHHVNETRTDNSRNNLVVCEDTAYHFLLHRRTKAYFACGHADWRKCPYCQQYDAPANMYIGKYSALHRKCESKREREKYLLKFGPPETRIDPRRGPHPARTEETKSRIRATKFLRGLSEAQT